MTLRNIASLLALGLTAICAPNCPGAEPPTAKTLFDFETADELTMWRASGVTAEWTADHATHGQHAVLLTYKPGDGLQTFIQDGGARKLGLAGFTHLVIDCYAPVNMEITVKLKSTQGTRKWEKVFALEPGANTLAIPFEGTGIDPATLEYINLFTGGLKAETVLYMDNVRGANVTTAAVPRPPAKPEMPDEERF